jgi:hypothetical protein
MMQRTYDKGGTLIPICLREMKHGVNDLDTRVGVDIDRLGIGLSRSAIITSI